MMLFKHERIKKDAISRGNATKQGTIANCTSKKHDSAKKRDRAKPRNVEVIAGCAFSNGLALTRRA